MFSKVDMHCVLSKENSRRDNLGHVPYAPTDEIDMSVIELFSVRMDAVISVFYFYGDESSLLTLSVQFNLIPP